MGPVAVTADHVLDNPVWSSVNGAHSELADVVSVGGGAAGLYQHKVAPFGAVEDAGNPACWAALASVLDGHATCVLLDPDAVHRFLDRMIQNHGQGHSPHHL